jgi:hypothetical protein
MKFFVELEHQRVFKRHRRCCLYSLKDKLECMNASEPGLFGEDRHV